MEKESTMSNILKSPISRSSILRSPMSKSPTPKSPIPKSPSAYKKYKSRCGFGLISFFNIRHGRSKKLISDPQSQRTSLDMNVLGDENMLEFRSDQQSHDDKSMVLDSGCVQVEKIKGVDVSIEQHDKKVVPAKLENVKSDSEHVDNLSRKFGKGIKTSRRPQHLPKYSCRDVSKVERRKATHQNLADSERTSKSKASDSASSAEMQLHPKNESNCNCMNCTNHYQVNEINLQVNMNEAAEAYINQKLIDGVLLGGDGTTYQSKHFLDALEILNSNRALFIKLLQDPNSLLVKHIEDLRDSQVKQQHKKQTRNARELNLSKETGDCQPLEKKVVTPSSESLQNCDDHRTSHDTQKILHGRRKAQQRPKSAFFAFEQMKRKLMRAMGLVKKEQQLILTDGSLDLKPMHRLASFEQRGKATGLDFIERNSSGRTKSSMDVERKEQMDKVNEFDSVVRDQSDSASGSGHENLKLLTVKHLKRNKHDVFVEEANCSRKQRRKSSNGISSVPECELFPIVSSRRRRGHGFVSPRKRGNWRDANEKKNSCSTPLGQNIEALLWAVDQKQPHHFPDDKGHKSIVCLNNDLNHTEEVNPPEVPSEPDDSHNNGVRPSIEILDTCEESGSMDFSREDSPLENQTSTSSIEGYSSSPLKSQIFREFDTIRDKEEHPSPVSVLDQFLTEEISSPLNNEFQPVLRPKRLLQINIEEDFSVDHHQSPSDSKINSSTSIKEHGSLFEYISTVLQSCHFSWDELPLKCHFSDQLLDQSLFDDTDVWANHFHGDHRLLLDYINEVLVDLNQCYLRFSPWLSFIKPIQPAMMTGSVAHQAMKNIDPKLFQAPSSQTLEQILANQCRTWMDIQDDVEAAVNEMTASILEELIMEFAPE